MVMKRRRGMMVISMMIGDCNDGYKYDDKGL